MNEETPPHKQLETARGGSGGRSKTAIGAGEGGGFGDYQGLPFGPGQLSSSMSRRAVICEKNLLLQQGLMAMIRPCAQVVECFPDGNLAERSIRAHQPDFVLLDVDLRTLSGVHVAERIHLVAPFLPIIVTTDLYHATKYFHRLARAGALAFCLKISGPDILLEAIGAALQGQPFCDNRILQAVKQKLDTANNVCNLTDSEIDVLIRLDLRNHEIAEELDISNHAVERHILSILHMMKIKTRREAAVAAVSLGLRLLPITPSRDPVTGLSEDDVFAEKLAKQAISRRQDGA